MIRHIKAAWHEAKKNHPILAKLAGEPPRSDKWPTVEHAFRARNPNCAACNGTEKINVHHKKPFHLHPELELEPSNLITLCMGEDECHIRIGHGDDFKAYNPNVVIDAADSLTHPSRRILLAAKAKAARLYE